MPVYVTGGGGTHLEPRITSHYFAALIAEAGARGVLGMVTAVKTQQSEIDAPLDDLVVEGRLPEGTPTRLDMQITTTLSFTESDDKWVDIVRRAWATFRRSGFNAATDRIGVAVSQTTTKLERSIQPLLARARHAADAGQYHKRLAAENGSNNDQREFQRILDTLIRTEERAATDDDILAFLKVLTISAFDLDQEDASRDRLGAIDQLAPIVGGRLEARRAWSVLTALASRVIPSGGGVDRITVVRQLKADGFTSAQIAPMRRSSRRSILNPVWRWRGYGTRSAGDRLTATSYTVRSLMALPRSGCCAWSGSMARGSRRSSSASRSTSLPARQSLCCAISV